LVDLREMLRARDDIDIGGIDSSGVDVVDATGTSVVDKSAPSRSTGIYTVTQDPTMFGWFVTSYEVSGTC